MFDKDAQILDGTRGRTTATEDLYPLLQLGETISIGPRNQAEEGEVIWTETVWESGRSSWENNLNWWMDGNPAVEAQAARSDIGEAARPSTPQLVPTSNTRIMRAIVTQARITRLTISPVAALTASSSTSSAEPPTAQMGALAATVALIGIVLLVAVVASEPTERPVSDRAWLVQALKGWLAVREGRGRSGRGDDADSPNERARSSQWP